MFLKYLAVTVIGLAISQAAQPPQAPIQSVSPSARVAALRFALQNDWQFPKAKMVVAVEPYFGVVDGHPVRQSDAERTAEALEMARLMGTGVKTVRAADYLDCPTHFCYASKDVAVLLVGGLFVGESDVRIVVHSPGVQGGPSSMTSAVIQLQRREGDWIGVRYSMGPTTRVSTRR